MLLWRAVLGRVALGRAVWRAAFGYVGSAYRHYMIGGVFGVVKGGFSGICRRTAGGGDSRLRGNDGRGAGMAGWGDGNGGTQRRKDAMKRRWGIPAYAGMTGGGVGYGVMGGGGGNSGNPVLGPNLTQAWMWG